MNGPWRHISVGMVAIGLVTAAAIVWGQTTERIETVEQRQVVLERAIDEIRRAQNEQLASLRGLEERSVRILSAIGRLDHRLDRLTPQP